MRRLLALIVVTCSALRGAPSMCRTLSLGQTLPVRTSSSLPACFVVVVQSGEATQLSVEQPTDLLFRLWEGAEQTVTDGFEFSAESLTIAAAGSYRIEIQPVDASASSVWTFSMSRRAIPLQAAQVWRRAETSATASKRTGKPADIAESLLLWEELGDALGIARTYLKQGDASLAVSDSRAARGAYEEALPICSSLGDLRCVAEAANNSGYVSFLLGDLEASSRRLREAAETWRRISSRLFEGRTLSNLGLMFWQSGDFEQAIRALNEAGKILRGRDAIAHARVLNNLGLCYQSLSENDKAVAYFRLALAVFQAQHLHTVRLRMNLGRSYMLLGSLERAEVTLEKALSEATEIRDAAARAEVLNNLGQVLLRLHRGDQARSRFTEALDLHRAVHSKWGEAVALHYLGIKACERGDMDAGRQSLIEAGRVRRQSGLRDDASESVFALAELEYRAGNLVTAHDLAGQAINLIESLRSKVPSGAPRYFQSVSGSGSGAVERAESQSRVVAGGVSAGQVGIARGGAGAP